jgi:hypothetical protein
MVVDVTVCEFFPHSIDFIGRIKRSVLERPCRILYLAEVGSLQRFIGLPSRAAISLEYPLGHNLSFC